jgi:hypothetical protein
LVLYIFGALSEEVEGNQQLHGSMSEFIVSYILPILKGNTNSMIKAHGCEVIAVYKYVDLPENQLQTLFQFIYNCLVESKDTYLNIYALEAFTELICKYDSFLSLIVPYLQNILNVYTTLMKESNGEVYEVIKSFELFLGHIDGKYLEDCAVHLVKFLTQIFYEHAEQKSPKSPSASEEGGSDDGLVDEDEEDENLCGARQGCLACIRQIISTENLPSGIYPIIINDCVLPLTVSILTDPELLHFE